MDYKKVLKIIIEYTSIAWKGCFTASEKKEFLENYLFEIDLLKNQKQVSALNWLCVEMLNDIYGDIEEVEEIELKNIKEFEKIANEYINLIINGGLEFSKLD